MINSFQNPPSMLTPPPDLRAPRMPPNLFRGWSDCEVLFQAAASTESPLPGPDVQDAWPPVE